MQWSKWPLYASGVLMAGGLSWIIKIAVIVATNGRIITSGPAAVLMTLGLILLPLGAAGVGAWLARRAHVALRVLAALAAVGALIACTVALGIGGAALFRNRGPAYASQEAGILFAGLLWCGVGAAALTRLRRASVMRGATI